MLLDLFITPAFAAAAPQEGNILLNLLPLVLLFVVFYFLLIRPQQKKAKEHKKMITEISKGDEIVTQGGFLGKVLTIDDVFLQIEITANTVVTIQRNSVGALMPKGTYKPEANSESTKKLTRKKTPIKKTESEDTAE